MSDTSRLQELFDAQGREFDAIAKRYVEDVTRIAAAIAADTPICAEVEMT